MNRLLPVLATGALLFTGCAESQEDKAAKNQERIEVAVNVLERAQQDFREASSDEERFFLQFLDTASYNNNLGDRWKVGDDCLLDTPFLTRELDRKGPNATIKTRPDGAIVVSPVGSEDSLVFEVGEGMLVPGGTDEETADTLGFLAAKNCLYGPRIVDEYDNHQIIWPHDTEPLAYPAP